MLIHRVDNFLLNGSGKLPAERPFRAVAIHPSSEVDLVDVGGLTLSPGAIIPLTRDAKLVPLRNAPTTIETGATYDEVPGHFRSLVGQQLVLQLYEECDALIPPPPLSPATRYAVVPAAAINVAIGSAAGLVMRVPMAGRRRCRISFRRTTAAADLSLVAVAVNWGMREHGVLYSGAATIALAGHFKENTAETWWNGGGAAPVATAGGLAAYAGGAQLQSRIIYVGGAGDAAETMDELLIFISGAAGGDAHIQTEAV